MENKEIIGCIDQSDHVITCKHCEFRGNKSRCESYLSYAEASVIHDDLKELESILKY